MLFILLGRVIQVALTLALTKFATTLLVPAEYGHLALINAVIAIFSLVLVNPLGMFINRRLHVWAEAGVLMAQLRRFCIFLFIVALVAGVATYVASSFGWVDTGSRPVWLMGLVAMSLVATTLNQTYIPALNMLHERVSFVVLSVSTLALNLILSIGLVRAYGANAEYWLLGTLLSQAVCAVLAVILLERHFQRVKFPDPSLPRLFKVPSRVRLKQVFLFAWPISLAVGLTWVQSQSYRFLVEAKLGADQLGLFVAGYSVSAGVLAAFEAVLQAYFLPDFYREVAKEDGPSQSQAWNHYAGAVFPSMFLTAAFVGLFARPLSVILLGARFHDVAMFTVFGAAAELARVFAGTYGLVAHARMKTHMLLIPYAIGALAATVLVLGLVSSFGLLGVAIGLAVAGWFVVVAMHFQMRRELRFESPFLRLRGVILGFIALCLLAYLVNLVSLNEAVSGTPFVKAFVGVGFSGLVYLALQYRLLRDRIRGLARPA